MIEGIDTVLTKFLAGLAHRSDLADWMVVFFASYSQYLLVGGTIVFNALSTVRNRHRFLVLTALAYATVSRFVITEVIRLWYSRPRPFVSFPEINPLIPMDARLFNYSFPSGHAVFLFAFAMAIYLAYRKPGRWLLLGASTVGIARVIAGVHWVSDIIGGAFVGIMGALLCDAVRRLIIHLRKKN